MFVWVNQKVWNFLYLNSVLDSFLTQLHFFVLYEVVTTDVHVYFLLQITHPAALTYKVWDIQIKIESNFIKYSYSQMLRPYGCHNQADFYDVLKEVSHDVNRTYTD